MTESEFRDFIREQTLRHERATRTMERWLRAVEVKTEDLTRATDEQIATLRDLVEESQAQRAALFTMMDKLDSGGAPPATA